MKIDILPIFSPIFQDFCKFIHFWNMANFWGWLAGGSFAGLVGISSLGGVGGCINPCYISPVSNSRRAFRFSLFRKHRKKTVSSSVEGQTTPNTLPKYMKIRNPWKMGGKFWRNFSKHSISLGGSDALHDSIILLE